MTWTEIQAAYPEQWVILGDLDRDDLTLELRSAVVRGHGATRREASASEIIVGNERTAQRYTGRPRSPRPW